LVALALNWLVVILALLPIRQLWRIHKEISEIQSFTEQDIDHLNREIAALEGKQDTSQSTKQSQVDHASDN
jgi:cell division protein ZapA (FtsZ GTPase activity inhibitor)